ncbi:MULTISPECIES: response regulator [unclassified Undibacterium]|uniref:response regulator n=1 Tax=unclassified Undibacterium TaxID=2630295 RepID=UPI002AC969F6|nr:MULTISPECIES: response regulator [unclassified Undibacterium]MEB0140978.1 response regulator [Undibacterium sp. CCC2.1]MEB0173464.1 response regulator [Undibacterium sp. CCC1.1]MEB0177198.1 response regulator [Undibacterium sp. CCC3.4]MEB0216463.1 response regulator [Undibacterium sp. 5I2]WPX42041.1 response regulator [Undibacterium sp. CCC3.4]
MSQKTPTIAIRLLGFSASEEDTFFSVLAVARETGYSYTCLKRGCLQDPDMYIVNAGELKALATLSDLHPGVAQPVLLIGKTEVDLPYRVMPRPIRWRKIFTLLDEMIDQRTLVLTGLSARKTVSVHERRRDKRLDLDLTDPDVYAKMRAQAVAKGGILVVDKDTQFREYVAAMMDPFGINVTLATDERSALMLDGNNQHALTLINTSMPQLDPYALCAELKRQNLGLRTTVILLVDKSFEYQIERAAKVGCSGFLVKPLTRLVLLNTMKKSLQLYD